MPILICLKEPAINLILAGDIKDEASAEYDALFPNIMIKKQDGMNMIIPLARDCNIAFMQEVTQTEIDKQRSRAKEKQQGQQRGSILDPTQFVFPSRRGGQT